MNIIPINKSVLGGIVGNVLEWYDFAVFGYFAPIIGQQFFPSDDPISSTLNAFGVFAAGYFMRPVGGFLFGQLGDKLGRKKALELSVLIMAIPTTLLGLLPTHAQIGYFAALLMVALRLIQGLSVGGEYVGSIAFVTEMAPPKRRGLWGSLTTCGTIGGIMLGSAVATVFHHFLDPEALASFGWRIPFLFGGIVGLVGLWLRIGLKETDQFEKVKQSGSIQRHPLVDALKYHQREFVRLLVLLLLLSGGFYALFVWWPTYLTKIITPPVSHALLVNTIAMVILMITAPVAGFCSDVYGRRSTILLGMAGVALFAYPLTVWTDHGIFTAALISQIIFALFMGFSLGPLPAAMSEMFPTRSRYSAVAVAYNLTVGWVGGTAPLICTWATVHTGDLAAPAYYLIALSLGSIFAAIGLQSKPAQRLD